MTDPAGYHNRNAAEYAADSAEIHLSAPQLWFPGQLPDGGVILDACSGVGQGRAAFQQAATPKDWPVNQTVPTE